jgi:ABC-type antimicrobial peptide transport system permease subunit
LVALSVALVGLVLLRRLPAGILLPAFVLHGYALSASVIGWETTPIAFYLLGLFLSQGTLLLLAVTLVRRWSAGFPAPRQRLLAGLLIGVLIARNIDGLKNFFSWMVGRDLFPATLYFLSRLPSIIDWREVLTVVMMAIVLSLLASLYPAWKAARLDPVEALRYE